MGKTGRSETPLWMTFVQGVLVSAGVYLVFAALTALLAVRGVLPERGIFPAVAAGCVLAACAGGVLCARRSPWGSLPSAMVCAAGFLAVVIAIGLLCWQSIAWLGQGGILIGCGAAGGVLAGLLGGRRSRRKRARRPHAGKRLEKAHL